MDRNFNGQNNFGGMNRQQPFDNEQAPQTWGSENHVGQAPNFNGEQAPQTWGSENHVGQAPNFNGEQAPQTWGSENHVGQAPNFNGEQAPQTWGNENLAGEEIFSGNDNFLAGAPADISEFVDTSTTGGFGEEKTFGNFAQGGLMPQMFGGRGGQFNQPQQPQQNQFK